MHILVSKRGVLRLIETVLEDHDLTTIDPCIIQIEDCESSYEFLFIRQNDICAKHEQVYVAYARPTSHAHYDWACLGLVYRNKYSTTIVPGNYATQLGDDIIRAGLFNDPADIDEDVLVKTSYLPNNLKCIADVHKSSYCEFSSELMYWSCTGYSIVDSD